MEGKDNSLPAKRQYSKSCSHNIKGKQAYNYQKKSTNTREQNPTDAEEQYQLGQYYKQEHNISQAIYWWRLAAEQGHYNAWLELDQYMDANEANERGLKFNKAQRYDEAKAYFMIAAKRGHKNACYNVGLCYEYGRGISRNISMACYYYKKAADLGHSKAAHKLTILQS